MKPRNLSDFNQEIQGGFCKAESQQVQVFSNRFYETEKLVEDHISHMESNPMISKAMDDERNEIEVTSRMLNISTSESMKSRVFLNFVLLIFCSHQRSKWLECGWSHSLDGMGIETLQRHTKFSFTRMGRRREDDCDSQSGILSQSISFGKKSKKLLSNKVFI